MSRILSFERGVKTSEFRGLGFLFLGIIITIHYPSFNYPGTVKDAVKTAALAKRDGHADLWEGWG